MGGLDLTFVNWDIISKFVLGGLMFSVNLTIVATVGGILFGTMLALMRLSGIKPMTLFATLYVNTMRSVPLVMVILLAVIWSIIFLDERLSIVAWVGGGLILLSAVLAA